MTDLEAGPGSRQNEVTLGIDTIKDDELKGTPEFEQLRVACETTKTFTPTVSKKLIKPFVARMDEETLMERGAQPAEPQLRPQAPVRWHRDGVRAKYLGGEEPAPIAESQHGRRCR